MPASMEPPEAGTVTTLRVVLDCGGPLRPEAALVVFADALGAMASAHENGEFHPHFTAEAVLIDENGQIAVNGFGETGESALDAPRYRAPERWAEPTPDAASDLYSATAVFFEALTGRTPYDAADLDELRAEHEQGTIPADDVPVGLSGLIAVGLAKQAAERPSAAREFLTEVGFAASADYGINWPEQGRSELSERVAPLLAALRGELQPVELPASAAATAAPLPPVPGARTAEDDKAAWRKRAIGVLGAAAMLGGAIAALTAINNGPSRDGLPHSNGSTSSTTSGGIVEAAPGSSGSPSSPSSHKPSAPGMASSSAPGRTIAGSPPLAPVSATSQSPSGSSPAPAPSGTTSSPTPQPSVTTPPAPPQPGPASARQLNASTSCSVSPAAIVVTYSLTTTSTEPLTVTATATPNAVFPPVTQSKQLSGATSYHGTITLPISRWAGWGGNWWTVGVEAAGASSTPPSFYC